MNTYLRLCLAFVYCSVPVACGGGNSENAATPPAAAVGDPVNPETAGGLKGSIKLEGTPPAPQTINRRSDPFCEQQGEANDAELHRQQWRTGERVRLREGRARRHEVSGPTTPVVLDQKGCTYVPRVFGIQAGQPLEILNSDETLHNIHALPMNNREFNRGQALKGLKHTHVFTTAEVMVPFKCDVHSWMNAWVGVLDHPFYTVSGSGGTFDINDLPPGTYTIEAWHEKFGTQTQMVTIGPKETKELSFTFKL